MSKPAGTPPPNTVPANVHVLQEARAKGRQYKPEGDPDPLPEEPPAADPAPDDEWQDFLPLDFPVKALGVQGRVCYFLDELHQLQDLAWKDIERKNIEGLMGRQPDLLEQYWPRLDAKGKEKGWRAEDVSRALKAACAAMGVWSPTEKVRGAGAWLGADGELIVHYGTRVVVYGADGSAAQGREPGKIGDLVYPSRPSLPQPTTEREPASGAAAEILGDLKTWMWARPEVDPYLELGHMVAGMLGGALKWRPLKWTTGGKGTGKSTLHDYGKGLLGRWLVSTSDATGAGIWQKLGFDSRPVAIDEAEGEEDNRRMNTLLGLARQAASGGVVLRGGADHEGREFAARSTFGLSSIAVPPLNSADRSRFVVLQLHKLPDGIKPPNLAPRRLEQLGRRLLRRIVDNWGRWADTLTLYREAMELAGHTARGADVFGTLLACQDLVRHDHVPDGDELARWTERLRVGDLAELAGDLAIEQACLLYLLTRRLEAYRGGVAKTIGEWVKQAADLDAFGHPSDDARIANDILKSYGMEVRLAPRDKATGDPKWPGVYFWVANRHTELARLFDRTKWQGGADTQGGWVQHLGWLPGARGNIPYWSGAQTKATLVPIDFCLKGPPDGGQDDLSAAGGSPGSGVDSGTAAGLASHRSAADPALSSSAPSPDPLAGL